MENKEHKVTIVEKIQHYGEINRARYCPANSNIIATSTSKGDINLYSMKECIGKLVGHTSEGYGLCWNNINSNLLVSGQTDKRLCIWDIEKNKQENQKIFPIFEILHHNAPI
jgi:histone-binding protein RBBP4